MADIQVISEISAPPNEIFVFFVPQRMPLWYGMEMDAHFEIQGGASDFAPTQKVRITGKLQRYDLSLTAVITAYEWEHLLEWHFQDSYGVRGMQRWELQALAGTTRVTMRDKYEMPDLFGRVFDLILTRRAVKMRDQSWLERLKHLAERSK
jgi:Polyketide cyclase / dehydrase and lipid transport